MEYLDRGTLLATFNKRLEQVETVNIAVAWATVCPALEALLEQAEGFSKKARIVVGISGNITTPSALSELQKHNNIELRISKGEERLFHPKYYWFKMKGNLKPICWIGSANLTGGGFGQNDELVHGFEDDGDARIWFDRLFNSLDENPDRAIEEYVSNWRPTRNAEPRGATTEPLSGHPITLLKHHPPTDWVGYYHALVRCDAYWRRNPGHFNVFDESNSYLHTIREGHRVAKRKDWYNLSVIDASILMGHRDESDDTAYGLLGSMKGAGQAVGVFRSNSSESRRIRENIKGILEPTTTASTENFPDIAKEVIERFEELPRFSSGVATRLMALLRPDCAVSVNSQSRDKLAQLSGIAPSTLGSPNNYRDLLLWLFAQRWYQSAMPDDPFGAELWSMRAALLDCFVYTPPE